MQGGLASRVPAAARSSRATAIAMRDKKGELGYPTHNHGPPTQLVRFGGQADLLWGPNRTFHVLNAHRGRNRILRDELGTGEHTHSGMASKVFRW
ncbi:MAG: hypothetical protein CME06_10990 [Gemmatimonadetes bacterium]|nr:hypothetical protein [Gemmatimonadota bacterium]